MSSTTVQPSIPATRTDHRGRADHRVGALVGRRLADVERDLIAATLARCGGNRTWAAEILGLSLAELRERLVAHEMRRERTAPAAKPKDRLTRMLAAYDPGSARPS